MIPVSNPYDPRAAAGMLSAFYAARVANWLLMAVAVLCFLVWAPALRNLTLVLYSLPTAIQQTVSINQESTIFFCMFVLLWLWWRKSSLAQILGLLGIITALSAMKAIYLVLLLLWACALWRWHQSALVPRRRFAAVAALGGIPIVIQALWSHFVVSVSGEDYLPGWGVAPHSQVVYLAQHPLQFLLVMLRGHLDLFGRGHMNGGWPGVLGVLGWADFEIGARGYAMLFLAVALAISADVSIAAATPDCEPPASPLVRYVLPALSAYLTIPSVILAMYVVFTKVGAPRAIGVQGRYLLFPYFVMLAISVDWARRRVSASSIVTRHRVRLRTVLPAACAVLCLFADYDAVRAILAMYHSA
jgi:uncharacterized membrane protein